MQIDSSYWHRWLAGFSDEWEVVVYLGWPSHTRKAIAFFVDKSSSVKAVAKVPLYAAATAAILNEAVLSRRLRSKRILPQILFADEERGIAAQTWVQGKAVSRTLCNEHIDLLSRLINEGASTRLCDYRDPIASCIDSLDLPLETPMRKRALYLLENTRKLPVFIEHRDFTPWNLRRLPDKSLTLVDWEWAVERGLPWQDICHFFYIQDYVFKGSGRVWETLVTNPLLRTYMHRFGIPSEVLPGLTLHYLIRTLCLDWVNAQSEKARYTIGRIRALLELAG
jgi:hypothetical protein